jgi:hypothetical protein
VIVRALRKGMELSLLWVETSRMSKIKRFNDYRHIKVEIKLPVGNSTDLITEDDMKVAKELLLKEWIQQREDIDRWFNLVAVEPKHPRLLK